MLKDAGVPVKIDLGNLVSIDGYQGAKSMALVDYRIWSPNSAPLVQQLFTEKMGWVPLQDTRGWAYNWDKGDKIKVDCALFLKLQ